MLASTSSWKRLTRISLSCIAALSCSTWFVAAGFAQSATPSPAPPTHYSAAPENEKSKPANDKSKQIRPAEPPRILQQLNSAIEELTARISPAVVQILVTGFGAVEESSQGQTALVAREHAIGSGVIVDPNGYIMTNAHVVEGAQRIHVALSTPLG